MIGSMWVASHDSTSSSKSRKSKEKEEKRGRVVVSRFILPPFLCALCVLIEIMGILIVVVECKKWERRK
jgi:hypothetical protein